MAHFCSTQGIPLYWLDPEFKMFENIIAKLCAVQYKYAERDEED